MSKNMKEVCRLCASNHDSKMNNIFTKDIKLEINLAEAILKYIGLPVSPDDVFPDLVCDSCTATIVSFHEYVEQCVRVQQLFVAWCEADYSKDAGEIKTEDTAEDKETNEREEPQITIKSEVDLEYHSDDVAIDYFSDSDDSNRKLKLKPIKIKAKKKKTKKSIRSEKKRSKKPAPVKTNGSKPDPHLRKYISFTCYLCNKSTPNWFRLKAHIVEVHKEIPKVKCICGCVVKSKTAIYRHVAGHNDPSRFSCDRCSRITKSQKALDRHKLGHIPKPERVYNCPDCTKVFNAKESLKSHQRVHIPICERYKYPCTICGKNFTTKSAVIGHTRAVHEKIKRYICDVCGYACGTKAELEQHRAIHSEEKLFPCSVCGKKFKTASNLKTHMYIHDSISYQCDLCPKVLNSRRTLRKHLIVHDDLCLHVCVFCNKAFKRRQTLKVHMTSHTGDTPIQCPWCPEKFAYSSACKAHKQRHHPEQLILAQTCAGAAPKDAAEGRKQKLSELIAYTNMEMNVSNVS